MPRPTLKLKPKRPPEALNCPKCEGWLQYSIQSDTTGCIKCDYVQELEPVTVTHQEHRYPEEWIKGQLLNVRKYGDTFTITVLGEEYDPQHPERALIFNNSYDCQQFTSWFYARDNHDPRAG
jgi:hypothetical protein